MKAYNDWMFDEWCAGTNGRLIPLPIVQLWDSKLAADEVRRNAARGGHAVCFTEIPPFLGLPSVHDADGYWDPFFQACAETETVVCMHIGSSSKMPSTSADAPPAVGSTLTYMNAAMSLTDYLMSGVLERFPDLTARVLRGPDRVDPVRARARRQGVGGEPRLGRRRRQGEEEAERVRTTRQVYGCFFDDEHGLESLERVGVDNVTFETDYPHSDSTWPETKEVAERHIQGLDDETIYKIIRGNAIRMLSLDLDGDRRPA